MRRTLSLFLPPVALMALIFFLSAQPSLDTGLGVWDLIGRKAIHMLEFGLLAFLWYRALTNGQKRWRPLLLLAAASIALGYAISDEVHQRYVAGRHDSPMDVLVDSVGILVAVLWVAREQLARGLQSPHTRN